MSEDSRNDIDTTPKPTTYADAEAARRALAVGPTKARDLLDPPYEVPSPLREVLAAPPTEVLLHRRLAQALGARFVASTDAGLEALAAGNFADARKGKGKGWSYLFDTPSASDLIDAAASDLRAVWDPNGLKGYTVAADVAFADSARTFLEFGFDGARRVSFDFDTMIFDGTPVPTTRVEASPRAEPETVDPKHFEASASYSAERTAPAPYVGPVEGVQGKAELRPFMLEVVETTWSKPGMIEASFGFPMPRGSNTKRLTLHVHVAPRGDEKTWEIKTDPEGRNYIDLWANMSFPVSKPDALCIRELVMNFVRHEVEESIMVNGVRIWDPHVGRPGGI